MSEAKHTPEPQALRTALENAHEKLRQLDPHQSGIGGVRDCLLHAECELETYENFMSGLRELVEKWKRTAEKYRHNAGDCDATEDEDFWMHKALRLEEMIQQLESLYTQKPTVTKRYI